MSFGHFLETVMQEVSLREFEVRTKPSLCAGDCLGGDRGSTFREAGS